MFSRRAARNRGRFCGNKRPPPLTESEFSAAVPPTSWLRADSYTDDGTKVTAWVDKVIGGHTMAQATDALRVAIPTVGASGKLEATFVRASSTRYVSSLPASSWAFRHDGTGCTEIHVVRTTSYTGGNGWIASTTDASAGIGSRLGIAATTGQVNLNIGSGTLIIVSASAPGVFGSLVACGYSYAEAESPKWRRLLNQGTLSSGSPTGAPSASAPIGTLTLGALTGGTNPHDGQWMESLFWNRVLSSSELSKVSSYLRRYSGL
jgi:hypothetical protein